MKLSTSVSIWNLALLHLAALAPLLEAFPLQKRTARTVVTYGIPSYITTTLDEVSSGYVWTSEGLQSGQRMVLGLQRNPAGFLPTFIFYTSQVAESYKSSDQPDELLPVPDGVHKMSSPALNLQLLIGNSADFTVVDSGDNVVDGTQSFKYYIGENNVLDST